MADIVDRSVHAATARFTLGLSPASLGAAYLDWAVHLERWPYNLLSQAFLLQELWWESATSGVHGVSRHHQNVVSFGARQILDMLAPSNNPSTNPEVVQQTMREGGMNFWRGAQNFIEDWERAVSGKKPVGAEAFQIGRNIAVTPGQLVYRNRLIELIQYAPATDKVRPEPVLIVPAWIMKYYILDLSPQNSLVKYLVDQGFTGRHDVGAGCLDTKQMAGTFQMLRSNDLIWSRVVHEFLMGERAPTIDLIAWNADATRMPYRMHSEYLRRLFLDNDLAEGRYEVDGKAIALTDIRAPVFAVGTEWDHVAPWHPVHKIHLLTDTDVTFVLTSGGHNAGIVSEPGHAGRHYRVMTKRADERYADPGTRAAMATGKTGSWWPEWIAWLAQHSGEAQAPPAMGSADGGYAPLCAAPGTYVLAE